MTDTTQRNFDTPVTRKVQPPLPQRQMPSISQKQILQAPLHRQFDSPQNMMQPPQMPQQMPPQQMQPPQMPQQMPSQMPQQMQPPQMPQQMPQQMPPQQMPPQQMPSQVLSSSRQVDAADNPSDIDTSTVSLLEMAKRDLKLPVLVFAIACAISTPSVTRLLGNYIPVMLTGDSNGISTFGIAINGLLIAVLVFVLQKIIN